MGEINEDNFEKNKKEILKCLDQYKLDTFVDYDNVFYLHVFLCV